MSIETSIRLTSYASLAAVATTGLVTEAEADLMIFDVGTTFSLQPIPTLGGPGPNVSSFDEQLRLDDLNATVNFRGFGARFTNSTNSDSFFRSNAWGVSFESGGLIAVDPSGKKARNFNSGSSVGNGEKGQSYAIGGKSKDADFGSGTKSVNKGAMEGQAFIGFNVPSDGLGLEVATYGWLDITLGLDESGKFALTINRWAYESEAGTAAQIPGSNPVPGVGGLLGLAIGAAGVRRRRDRVA